MACNVMRDAGGGGRGAYEIETDPPSAAYMKEPMKTSSVDETLESIEPLRRSARTQHNVQAARKRRNSRRLIIRWGGGGGDEAAKTTKGNLTQLFMGDTSCLLRCVVTLRK